MGSVSRNTAVGLTQFKQLHLELFFCPNAHPYPLSRFIIGLYPFQTPQTSPTLAGEQRQK
jgi:hypothetical protein